MKKTKEVTLKLQYCPSKVDKEKGIYEGGVALPRYVKELAVHVSDDIDYDLENDQIVKTGMLTMEISGTDRALKEFGKFLVNMATYKTKDEGYHEHIDNICNTEGKPFVNLVVRKQARAD